MECRKALHWPGSSLPGSTGTDDPINFHKAAPSLFLQRGLNRRSTLSSIHHNFIVYIDHLPNLICYSQSNSCSCTTLKLPQIEILRGVRRAKAPAARTTSALLRGHPDFQDTDTSSWTWPETRSVKHMVHFCPILSLYKTKSLWKTLNYCRRRSQHFTLKPLLQGKPQVIQRTTLG